MAATPRVEFAGIAPHRARIDARPRTAPSAFFPLSFVQERLWLLEHWQPASTAHSIVHVVALDGRLDRAALADAFNQVVERHEAWRTTIVEEGGRALQHVTAPKPLAIAELDVGDAPIEAYVGADVERPIDLQAGSLVRATLAHRGPNRAALIVSTHAIVGDEDCGELLLDELATFYAHALGQSPAPPALPVQYGDYAAWQRHECDRGKFEEDLAYWTERLSGAPASLELPADCPRPAVQTFRGARRRLEMNDVWSDTVQAGSIRTSRFTTTVAAFEAVLARYTGQTDIVVGMPRDDRFPGETDRLLGAFADVTVCRTDLSGDPSFEECVARVHEALGQTELHARVPFAKLVERVQPVRNLSYSPVFQIQVSRRRKRPRPRTVGDLTFSRLEVDRGVSHYDLTLVVDDTGERAALEIQYNPDLFHAATIDRLLGHVAQLLEAGLREPSQQLSELPLLTAAESAQLQTLGTGPVMTVPSGATTVQAIAAQTAKTPTAMAVSDGERTLTYGTLEQRASALARYLRARGVGPDVLVGVCLTRSADLVWVLLGVWKAGGAYLPLDPAYPGERLDFMMRDAEVRIVVTESSLTPTLPSTGAELVVIDGEEAAALRNTNIDQPLPEAQPDDLAYVIYTSGSTGRPKGVEIPHGAVLNVLSSLARWPGLHAADRMLAVTTLAFDIAAVELWLPLLVGARVELVNRAIAADGSELRAAMRARGATVMQATPATWRALLESGWDGSPPVRVWCGGEALPRDLADRLRACSDEVWNLYGPTETAIWSAAVPVPEGPGPVPIGGPLANTRFYVLDGARARVPLGVPGELYIGGAGLARGYRRRPELTGERFVRSPFDPDQRLYRTGDRVRARADGTLEYLGRFDDQVKLRGFRIELGEVEAALRSHGAVRDAVAAVHAPGEAEARLVAYLVVDPAVPPTPSALQTWLRNTLPDYMVPTSYVYVDQIPRTLNGKVDRRALPSPDAARTTSKENFAPPRTTTEARLAQIWCDVLHVPRVGLHDSFFELGGQSLLGVRLFAQIERDFDMRLPLATLLESQTLERMAELLDRSGDVEPSWSSLVPIQRGGDRVPFFCMHGGGANVLALRTLARHLGTDQPFYGLQSQGLDGETPPYRRVEEMAEHYVREIRAIQPVGPYMLGGFSFGGLIAFEMAQQLTAQGLPVGLLAMIDTFFPSIPPMYPRLSRFGTMCWPLVIRLERDLEEWQRLGTRQFLPRYAAYVREGVMRRIVRGLRVFLPDLRGERWDISDTLRRVIDANLEAEEAYVPKKYPGRVAMFWGTGETHPFHDTRLAWDEVARDGLEIHIVPGDHNSLREEPNVLVLASKLRALLDRQMAAERTFAARARISATA